MTEPICYQTLTRDLAETDELARQLASSAKTPLVIGLTGTLGAGKTRLVQSLAAALGVDPEEVTSPTYTLWQTYATTPVLHHLDAYRIQSEEEFWDLGIEEFFETSDLIVIEWANKFPAALPEEVLWIEVAVTPDQCRLWRFTPMGVRAAACVAELMDKRDASAGLD